MVSRISVGSATNVWGVNTGGSNPWFKIPGALIDVGAASDGTVWGVNSASGIYRFVSGSDSWTQISGSPPPSPLDQPRMSGASMQRATSIATRAMTVILGVQTPGTLTDIGTAADSTVWGIKPAGDNYRYDSASDDWAYVTGSLTVGSAADVWGVNADDDIYSYTGAADDSNPWAQVPGLLTDVGVGADGIVWGANAADFVYCWNSV